tara:strand:+ start:521 stop:2884 length:2364 start_codon:yes stop_codon:yes gene_type:complete
VFDVEANGLLHQVTKLWCIACTDYETGENFLFHDYPEYDGVTELDDQGNPFTIPIRNGSMKSGVLFLHKAKSLICHNVLGYDFAVLKKFYPKFKIRYNYPEIRDTLLESQVQWYDRKPEKGYKGIHGLEVYGARFGIRKPPIKDWSFIDAQKLNRCIEDIAINVQVARFLEEERERFKKKQGLDFIEALTTEHEYRYWSTIQELNGALADVPHMKACCVELDGLLKDLRAKLKPELPPSLKVKGAKETANFVATALGSKNAPPICYEWRLHDGENKRFAVKQFYKPITNWLTVKKGKLYKVVLDSEDVTEYTFSKLREARDWVKKNYPDTKLKFRYPSIATEVSKPNGYTVDHFAETLEYTEILGPHTKVSFSSSKMSQHEKVKLYLVGLGWKTDEWTFKKDAAGQFIRAEHAGKVTWPPYKVNGNQLTEYYKKGDRLPLTPKVTEDSFLTLPDGLGDNIKKYNAYAHRRNFIQNPNDGSKGLLNTLREDGRISAGLMTFGTSAGRASQWNWVNAPSVEALYGENIRKIVIAPEGHKLIGVDMPSAHPRILADDLFTGNAVFQAAVDGLEADPDTGKYIGEDFHTVNSVLFGLNKEEDVLNAKKSQLATAIAAVSKGRKIGKGGSYCTLYGGSAKKLAITIGIPENMGAKIMEDFLSGLGLDKVLKEAEQEWKRQKHEKGAFISVLGGYHVWANSKHKIINYKALGSEAVIQKRAVIWVSRQIRDLGLKTKLVINMHDELLFESPDHEVDQMVEVASKMYQAAAEELGLTLNWSSLAMVGMSYAACH